MVLYKKNKQICYSLSKQDVCLTHFMTTHVVFWSFLDILVQVSITMLEADVQLYLNKRLINELITSVSAAHRKETCALHTNRC